MLFVECGGNFLASVGIPLKMAIAIMAVLVAKFCGDDVRYCDAIATVCDPGTSPGTMQIKPLTNRYAATALALVLGGAVALMPGPNRAGKWGVDSVAPVRCGEPTLGGTRLYGDGLLSAATESARLVRSDPDGGDVDYAGVGDAVADV